MGYMKNLAIELENMGIDADLVNLDILFEYMAAYRQKTGKPLDILKAAREVYK